jgi:hypothetical protein
MPNNLTVDFFMIGSLREATSYVSIRHLCCDVSFKSHPGWTYIREGCLSSLARHPQILDTEY